MNPRHSVARLATLVNFLPVQALKPVQLRYLSPLRYPGGKGRVAPFIASLLDENEISGGTYFEPYAGGAGVALYLLFTQRVKKIVINDIDPGVHAFWHSALSDADKLCDLIRRTPVTIQTWGRQLEIYRDPESDLLRRGFATFFLNRTNRSGIICSGGPIGGSKQVGALTLGARYNKRALIERIERIGQAADAVELLNQDALAFFRNRTRARNANAIWYLDPPYYVKGSRRLYASFYEAGDHKVIAEAVRKSPARWIVSYDDDVAIRDLYKGCPCRSYTIGYSARKAYQGREVMFASKGLKFPDWERDEIA